MRIFLAVLCAGSFLGLAGCPGNRSAAMDGGPCADGGCADGLDNGGDGPVDGSASECDSCDDGDACALGACDAADACVPTASSESGALCQNGLDDDCNGLVDCNDLPDCFCSCTSCDDGNPCTADSCLPADGCLHAFDCSSLACTDPACGRCTVNEMGLCADRIDNDCDGLVDCADPDCAVICP